jgi:hypothetical protein
MGEDFFIPLSTGWNMTANPFPEDTPIANARSAPDGAWAGFGFALESAATGTYTLVSSIPALNATPIWEVRAGMWAKATSPASIVITRGTTAAGVAAAGGPQRQAGDFLIRIEASANGRADACAYAGVLAQAAELEINNPPQLSPYVDVCFYGEDGEPLSYALAQSVGERQSWDFEVRTDMANAEVAVSLPDLSEVPRELGVWLTDLDTEERIYARTAPVYRYNSGPLATPRRFRLEAAPRNGGALALAGVVAQAARGGSYEIAYGLNAPAAVTIEVLNIAGRPVRTVVAGEEVAPGRNTALWNGLSESGLRAPAGRYLVRIQARAADNQFQQAVTTLQVGR